MVLTDLDNSLADEKCKENVKFDKTGGDNDSIASETAGYDGGRKSSGAKQSHQKAKQGHSQVGYTYYIDRDVATLLPLCCYLMNVNLLFRGLMMMLKQMEMHMQKIASTKRIKVTKRVKKGTHKYVAVVKQVDM